MKKMKRFIKRVMLYLALGFVMSWLVAWGLAMMPHRVDPGRYTFSQFSSARPGVRERETYFIYDSRWFGAIEHQYSTIRSIRRSRKIGGAGPPTQLWWAWEPGAPATKSYSLETTELYLGLKARYSGLEIGEEPVAAGSANLAISGAPLTNKMFYSVAKYGWPALSHRVEGAYNASDRDAKGSMSSDIAGAVSMPITENLQLARFAMFPYHPMPLGLAINTLFYAILAAALLSIKRAYRHARRLRKGRCPMCSYELLFDLRDGCSECGWRKD